MSKRKNVAVLFGGRSPEHEISIITGVQVLLALNQSKYKPYPVYVTKKGEWVLGDESFLNPETFKDIDKAIEGKKRLFLCPDTTVNSLIERPKEFTLLKSLMKDKIDIFFPAFHGKYGEDGSIQGLFELANEAYTGCGVTTSAIGMDKALSKRIAKQAGIPVLDDIVLTSANKTLPNKIKYPVFVKPATLGSSIGITKAKNVSELKKAIDVAFFYDHKVLIEPAFNYDKEVNISIIGNDPYELSVTEQPVSSGEVLSFKDKYITKKGSKGMASAKRIIPAPINKSTEKKIREYTETFFREIGGQGMARIDFMVGSGGKVYFNEINTLPGSVSFYLWKETNLKFDKLVDKLIKLGLERHKQKNKLNTIFKSNVLAGFGKGLKGAKGKA